LFDFYIKRRKEMRGRRGKSSEGSSIFFGTTIFICVIMVIVWIYAFFVTADISSIGTPNRSSYTHVYTGPSVSTLLGGISSSMEEPYIIPPESRPPLKYEAPESERDLPYDNLYHIIESWNPDEPEVSEDFQERLQHFNYGDPYERELAMKFRDAEVPFKLYNVSKLNEISTKWTDSYLIESIGSSRRAHIERSNSNHFMFWSGRPHLRNYKPPTEIVSNMKFQDWLALAKEADRTKKTNNSEYYYFMMGADAHENGRTFISRDIPMFSTSKNNFFITNVDANKGIQCRFGMRGVIAESHYDSGKNMVAMVKGSKRYILAPPRSCDHLAIIPDTKHPSYRHSTIDWSDLSQAKANKFDEVDAIDTILHHGEILYIPSYWFHYIISLNYSIQCNSRSGAPKGKVGWDHIVSCFEKSQNKII
jgi:hypothetical protein